MAFSTVSGLCINGIISVLPKNVEDNLELDKISESECEAIVNHTGIRFRHRVNRRDVSVKDLFSSGIESLLKTLEWEKSSVDLIVVVTQTAENSIPSVACELQGDLGFDTQVMAYDMNLGCSGFVYGLHSCAQTLNSFKKGNARAILCCGDISSQLTEDGDLTVRPIFSDAASVAGIEFNPKASPAYFHFETFGEGKNAIYTEKTSIGNWMRLNGIDIFNYSVKHVPSNIKKLYEHFDLSVIRTDLFVLHQANLIINKSITKALQLPPEKAPSSLYEHGNTASASIPITLALNETDNIKMVLLSGFGVGFSIASCLIAIDDPIKTELVLLDV